MQTEELGRRVTSNFPPPLPSLFFFPPSQNPSLLPSPFSSLLLPHPSNKLPAVSKGAGGPGEQTIFAARQSPAAGRSASLPQGKSPPTPTKTEQCMYMQLSNVLLDGDFYLA